MSPGEQDLVLGVMGVQLGYVTPDDVLAAASELVPPSKRTLAQVLELQGALTEKQREVLERLAQRAVSEVGSASQTLELLPAEARRLLAESSPGRHAVPQPATGPLGVREPVCVEQPGRYQLTPAGSELRHDSVFGRDVMWTTASGEAAEARLLADARLAAQLDHPAVLPVFEIGRSAEGLLYVTLQRVGGRTLASTLLERTTAAERLTLVPSLLTVCQCVAAAHERGVTHGALSAQVVLLGDFGEVYVTGWSAPLTQRVSAERALADLRALGSLLHEVLTGLPAPASGVVNAPGAPGDLLAVARHAAAGGIETLDSVHLLARELKAWLDGRRVASHHYSARQLMRRYGERHRTVALAALGALVLLATLGSITLTRLGRERDRARHFAEVFLDDVGQKLRAVAGVEPLLDQVTTRAIAQYQRTNALGRATPDERVRTARALVRLAGVSTELGRLDEATRCTNFASSLVEAVPQQQIGALQVKADLLIAQSRLALARNAVAQARGLARQAVRLADEAVLESAASLEAVDLAVRARLRLRDVAEPDEAREAMARVVTLATAAGERRPTEVDALRLLSVGLAAKAEAARQDAPGGPWPALFEQALTVAREAAAQRPEDDELQVMLLERLTALGHTPAGPALLAEARERALKVLRRSPGHVAARQALVAIELTLGHAEAAWELARALEAQGQVDRVEGAPLACLLAGHLDDAVRLAARPGAGSEAVLVHALAQALRGHPAEAVVQARGLRGRTGQLTWPDGATASLAVLPAFSSESTTAAAALAFARSLEDAQADHGAALEQFIAALEGALAKP
jgi:tetratricopeptide (TPR) repeat protein